MKSLDEFYATNVHFLAINSFFQPLFNLIIHKVDPDLFLTSVGDDAVKTNIVFEFVAFFDFEETLNFDSTNELEGNISS